jgi:enoyl-[acyl-carrier protein] reductase I
MGLMDGKVVVIFGVANKRSIAWGITRVLVEAGAKVALNYQNDRMKDSVEKLVEELPTRPWMAACDVTREDELAAFFTGIQQEFGQIDGLVHSVAFAPKEELSGEFQNTSWDGYQLAHRISAYSLIPMCKLAAPLMEGRQGSVVSLTYIGSERVVEGYNLMGIAKAALESNTRYLAANLGPQGIRVNAISAGPVKTVSAMGIGGFANMLDHVELRSPLRRNVTQEDVGKTALFLLSELASGVTGQIIHVDSGYSILGV